MVAAEKPSGFSRNYKAGFLMEPFLFVNLSTPFIGDNAVQRIHRSWMFHRLAANKKTQKPASAARSSVNGIMWPP
jgi:hypothetical protein